MARLDDAPIRGFHVRVCLYTAGGFFCDGYILGSIGLALPLLAPQMQIGPLWVGLLGAAALVGVFFGAIVVGPITDVVGRQKMLVVDLILFTVFSVLQLFVTGPVLLLVLRLALGFAIGADYAIAPALLSEFLPRRHRGRFLSTLNATFTVGFVASYGVGFVLQSALGEDSWRWMLAASAVPAFVTLLLRLGTPESPRWLVRKGRHDAARAVLAKYFGPEYEVDEQTEPERRANYRALFSRAYLARTVFAGMFWFCQVFPYFGIGVFLPKIVEAFGIGSGMLGEALYNVLLLVGAIVGLFIMDTLRRRSFVIWSFVIVGIALVLLGALPDAPLAVLMPVFLIMALVLSAAADLESVYPSEVFPTEVRASGVGLASAISRVGAAISTFVLPSALENWGIGATMLLLAGVVGVGAAVSVALAPETRGVHLGEASRPLARERTDV